MSLETSEYPLGKQIHVWLFKLKFMLRSFLVRRCNLEQHKHKFRNRITVPPHKWPAFNKFEDKFRTTKTSTATFTEQQQGSMNLFKIQTVLSHGINDQHQLAIIVCHECKLLLIHCPKRHGHFFNDNYGRWSPAINYVT
jgi:hypothetical protein